VSSDRCRQNPACTWEANTCRNTTCSDLSESFCEESAILFREHIPFGCVYTGSACAPAPGSPPAPPPDPTPPTDATTTVRPPLCFCVSFSVVGCDCTRQAPYSSSHRFTAPTAMIMIFVLFTHTNTHSLFLRIFARSRHSSTSTFSLHFLATHSRSHRCVPVQRWPSRQFWLLIRATLPTFLSFGVSLEPGLCL
jgi:hypothetical protein